MVAVSLKNEHIYKVVKPKKLNIGDRIGIIALSTPISQCAEYKINRALNFLKQKGFEMVEAKNCRKQIGHTAGSIEERIESLHHFFYDPTIKAILSFWGGYQTHQVIEKLDYELIKNNPKPLIGYSDTTALQNAILVHSGLVTFSGPAVITFAKPIVPTFTWQAFESILLLPQDQVMLSSSERYYDNLWEVENNKDYFLKNQGWQIYSHGVASGQIIGGNLGSLLLLAGTKYWPNMHHKILFLEEDEHETPERIDRMMTQLKQIGVFEQINALIIGRFPSSVGFSKEDSFEMILAEVTKGYEFPIITNVDFGHTDPIITIPIGIKCCVDTYNKKIIFLENAVLF